MANWKEKLGAGIGGALGGVGGFFAGGPWGALAGASAGASAGEYVTGGGGDFWDTHIGREGLIGGIGDLTGLWESGTTADKRRKALDRQKDYIDELEQKKADVLPDTLRRMNKENVANAYQFEGLLGGMGSGSLATDNNRTIENNKLIANSIAKRNASFENTMNVVSEKRDAYDDNLFLAEQTKRDLS